MFKPKPNFAGAAALVVALMYTAAHAAEPAVPPNSIGPDTVAVFHVDSAHFNPDLLKETAKTLLGPNAKTATEAITEFSKNYDMAIKSGVEGITVVIGEAQFLGPDAGPEKPTPNVAYVQLRPEADVKAVAKLMISDMDQAQRDEVVFEQKGTFLVMHVKDVPLPTTFDAARAQAFADALGTISGASLQLAIIMTPRVKQEMARQEVPLKGMKEAQMAFADSKWVTVAMKLGSAPQVTATVNSADANGAKHFSDGVNLVLDDGKKQILANPRKPGDDFDFSGLFAPVLDSLRPTTDGNTVSVTLKGEPLRIVAICFVSVNRIKSVFGHSKQVKAKVDITDLELAVQVYKSQCGQYPRNLDALVHNPGIPGWQGPYLRRGVPNDPWGHPYRYASPGDHFAPSFDLWSDGDGYRPPDDLNNWTHHDAN